jgi:hypothetical protein
MFSGLRQPAFFRNFKVEPGGYAIVWKEEIDSSEYELWKNGVILESRDLASDRPSNSTIRAKSAIALLIPEQGQRDRMQKQQFIMRTLEGSLLFSELQHSPNLCIYLRQIFRL